MWCIVDPDSVFNIESIIDPITIGAGDSATFHVDDAASDNKFHDCEIEITSNDTDENPFHLVIKVKK